MAKYYVYRVTVKRKRDNYFVQWDTKATSIVLLRKSVARSYSPRTHTIIVRRLKR